MNTIVDTYINKLENWKEEFQKLRMIVSDCQLTEDFKWGCPCYSYENKNVVLIHGFKNYCALLFFKGVLLSDSNNILIQQTENVQAGRQIRFTNIKEIEELESILRTYIYEAIEVEKSGVKVNFKKPKEIGLSEEFKTKLKEIPELKTAFFKLTPGRQKEYNRYFSEPKQEKTRESRIEKCINLILSNSGLNDKYKR